MAKGKEFKHLKNKPSNRFQTDNLASPPNYDLHKPIFSLKHMRYQGDYCISKCERETKSLIIDTILRLSQYTWAQLKTFPKNTAFEPIPIHRFKASFPPVVTEEVSILVARYDNGGRIAGYREKDIFHIIIAGKDLYSH
jgi:hypothetical protein